MSQRCPQTGAIAPASARVRLLRALRGLVVLSGLLTAGAAQALSADRAFHNYVRDSWSLEQGLPQIAVPAIAQDGDGYLWAGTMNGLARFDGVRFVTFNPGNTPALPGTRIQALKSDGEGRLWIATQNGLAWYHAGRFTTVPVENPAANAELDVQDVLPAANGEVLVATTSGLFRVVDGKLQSDPAVAAPLYALLEAGGRRWLGSGGGVYRIERGVTTFEVLPGLGLRESVLHLVATRDRLWAGTSAGLFYRDGAQPWQRFDAVPALALSTIGVLFEDSDSNLWVGTANGLARLRDNAVAELVDNDRMGTRWDYLTAFEDRENNLWFGSRTRGLTRLWNGLSTRYSVQEGLITPLVWSLSREADGRVWVGTDNGLSLFEQEHFRSVLAGSALPDPNVYSLLAEDDQVWLGTLHGAALLRHGHLEHPAFLAALDGLRINGIFRDSRHRLWFATSEGLFRDVDATLTRFGTTEGLADPSVRLLFETRDGRLLLGTQNGLAEFSEGRVHMFTGAPGLPTNIDVTAIHQLADGRLIVGTATEQLFVADGGRWLEFNHDNGLPQNPAFFITDDGRGYLWVAGLRGIYRVPLHDLHARTGEPLLAHGELVGNELAARSTGPKGDCCNGAGNSKGFFNDGRLWLPTRDGVLAMPTDSVARNPVPPTMRVESVNDGEFWRDGSGSAKTVLPAAKRDLTFRFTALSFQDPSAVHLMYRLTGYDHDWRTLADTQSRSADYTHLPPGAYVFEVRGANSAGVWSEAPAMLPFRIAPYFYETLWFGVLIALLVAALIYAGHRWQLRALTRRRVYLESLVAQRTDALALANRQLECASYTDPLTGLRNRRYLLNQLPQDLAFYARRDPNLEPDHVLLFALIDIDHFKQINDGHGHGGGDLVLQQFAALLTELVRVGDYVTRWGGEEFLIVTRPLPRDAALAFVERICTKIAAQAFEVGAPTPLHLTCSIGFAECSLQALPLPLDWQNLIELADRAMYRVKESGRNGWAAFRFTASTPFRTLMQALKDDGDALLAEGRLKLISSADPPVQPTPGWQNLPRSGG